MKDKEIKIITGVSHGFFSVARHYGGCTFQGKHFVYIPKEDALIRKDVVKAYTKAVKAGKTLEEFSIMLNSDKNPETSVARKAK